MSGGAEKRQAEKVREYIEKLKKNIEGLEIYEVDERMTTVSADRMLTDGGKNRKRFHKRTSTHPICNHLQTLSVRLL